MYWISQDSSGRDRQMQFFMDSDDDVQNLPGINTMGVQQGEDRVSCLPVDKGSMALSIESGKIFILNSNNAWKRPGAEESATP